MCLCKTVVTQVYLSIDFNTIIFSTFCLVLCVRPILAGFRIRLYAVYSERICYQFIIL